MSTKIIVPDSEQHWLDLRKRVLTSTDVAALFNLSPYQTYSELWYRKKGLLDVTFEENRRMTWGRRLEPAIASGIAEDHGLKIRPMKEFYIDEERRIGASFDFAVEPDGILEIKNLDSLQFKERWEIDDDGSIEAPPHIELQGQHQLMVADRKKLYIGALVGGNDSKIIERDADPEIHAAIETKSAEFWASIDANEPPAPNFETDAALICKLYGFAEPGKVLNFETNKDFKMLGFEHRAISEQIKILEAQKESLKAHMLMMIGDSEKVLCGDFSVTAGVVGPAHVEYDRDGYRQFRLNWKRGKKNG